MRGDIAVRNVDAIVNAANSELQHGGGDEDNKLKKAINATLKIVIDQEFGSIFIPAISAGIFGFPKDKCAEILVGESKKTLASDQALSLETVEFCLLDDEALSCSRKAFEKIP